jgi:UDP-N-acetylglucosamine 2-epimerase (non-hydrolysing)
MKAAPVIAALGRLRARQTVVHTGQHYDTAMSAVFFHQLGMPEPDVNLAVGSGSHAGQTAEVMTRFEPVLLDRRPDLVLVYGDVNSTVAAALVCAKLVVPIGHVEAGLRSFDRTMPEEINRLVTDRLADIAFTPSEDGDENLLREGIASEKIHRVGNVMIDTLIRLLPTAEQVTRSDDVCETPYSLVTLHRPSNVDEPAMLERIVRALTLLSRDVRVIFPVHPRTRKRIEELRGWTAGQNVRLIDPVGYVEFLALQMRARLIITDSGGIQEESTYLGIPCLTIRCNTERPITVTLGTNVLVGQDMNRLLAEARGVLAGGGKKGCVPPLWDGSAAERIAHVILSTRPEQCTIRASGSLQGARAVFKQVVQDVQNGATALRELIPLCLRAGGLLSTDSR